MNICIISGTAREGRWSHKVALAVQDMLSERSDIDLDMVDVKAYNFPLLDYTYPNQPNPSEDMVECHNKLKCADSFIVVCPEYNGSYPGALKNTLDYFLAEYKDKAFGLVCVSGGRLGGYGLFKILQGYIFHLKGIVYQQGMLTPGVSGLFNEKGELTDEAYRERMQAFLDGFIEFADRIGAPVSN